ncbi:hypothetical protein KEM55_006018 [Ascosphaera atra]|nr:hypothetical protein KEM55_006018 [Ascosphaera atra]
MVQPTQHTSTYTRTTTNNATPNHDPNPDSAIALTFKDLNSLRTRQEAIAVLDRIARIEKRTFPTSEAFPFDDGELWRKKANTAVIYAELSEGGQGQGVGVGMGGSGAVAAPALGTVAKKGKKNNNNSKKSAPLPASTSTSSSATPNIVAYAVYVRLRTTALLHKVCVAEPYRGRGLGKRLLSHIIRERLGGASGGGCQSVTLWVDEGRPVARRLYEGCGFEEVERVEGYYGPGRNGCRMVLDLWTAHRLAIPSSEGRRDRTGLS